MTLEFSKSILMQQWEKKESEGIQTDVLIQRHVSILTDSQLQDNATHTASEQTAVRYVLPEDENLGK